MTTDYRKEFADFDDVIYMDMAAQSAIPLASARAAHAAVDMKKLPYQIPVERYYGLPDSVREKLAALIGTQPDEIALTTGASTGFAIVAHGLDWKPGDEILVGEGEFPAHFASWIGLQQSGKATIRIVRPRERFITVDDYVAAMGPKTRIVSASFVRFDNAVRLDVPRLAKTCHEIGAALLLDASQGVGGIPLDANACGADFITSAGYKWLLGPYGTGFFWVRREWWDKLRPAPAYWAALEGARAFQSLPLENPKLVPGARKYDTPETANFFNLSTLEASLEFVLRVTPAAVEKHNAELLGTLIERLPRDKCVLASPSDAEKRGPFVNIMGRTPQITEELHAKLRAEKIIVSARQGTLRIAPYLFNTPSDVERLISFLSV